MANFDPNEARDSHGMWTDGGAAIRNAAMGKKSLLEQFTVGYAPFREGDISNLNEGEKAFNDPRFKAWRDEGTNIANMMGLKINQDSNSIGVYEATSNNAEASRVVEITGTKEAAEAYGAIMGTLAPDKQHTVMVNRYDNNGDASEHYITFRNKESAISFVENRKAFGINDVSYFPGQNKVLVLDFGNFDKTKTHQVYDGQIKNIEQRKVNTRFIGEDEYGAVVRSFQSSLSGHDKRTLGPEFDNIVRLTEKRLSRQR